MAAADGQTLDQQSAETQAAFQAAHGDNAAAAWEAEHNAAIGGGGGGGGGVPQMAGGGQSYPGVSNADVAAIQAGFQASAGLSVKQLNENMRQFDAELAFKQQQWQQDGLPRLAIAQRTLDLEQKKFEELSAMATRQQDFTEEAGRRQAALAEKTQADANAIEQGRLGLGQSQLGADVLKTAASLTGPADWIKAVNYARGVQQTNLPSYIQQLLTGKSTATLGGPAPGTEMSAPQSLINLANQVSGTTGGTTGTGTDYAAQRLRSLFAAGGQALSPQALEGLTSSEKAMLTGGGADVGADVGGFMDQYNRSRIGQQAATPGTF